jgi:hypothetical protein
MGYKANTYTVTDALTYIPVIDVQEAKILVVDRNGIGVKVSPNFDNTPTTVDVYVYEWYGVKLGSLSSGNRLIVISNSVVSGNRVIIYEVGPTPTAGSVYSVFNGANYAKYKVQTGDTTTAVRNGLKSAIDAVSWGFTLTTTSISTNQLRLNITGTQDFTTQLGTEKFKKGRYCFIAGTYYLINELESFTAMPTLPSLAASYNFPALTALVSTPQIYLSEPLTTIIYSASLVGTTNILGVSSSVNVPANTCVLDEPNQRLYFDAILGLGEKIKVFQK